MSVVWYGNSLFAVLAWAALFTKHFKLMIEVKKTTYLVDGIEESCYEVSDGYAMVRIAKMYHLVGHDTLALSEYLDGEWNGSDEWAGDFDELTEFDARRIAKKFSAYLN